MDKKGEKIDKSKITFIKTLPDKSVIFTCPYAEITIPQDYIDRGISEIIGNTVETFGLFEIKVWSTPDVDNAAPTKYFFKFKSKITTAPSNIKTERNPSTGEKELTLCYNEGATFITSIDVQPDLDNAKRMLDVMTFGYLPNILSYEEIPQYWSDVNEANGIGLDAMSQTSIELIVSELIRDPKNPAQPFRKRLREDPKYNRKGWKIMNINRIPKYTSALHHLHLVIQEEI